MRVLIVDNDSEMLESTARALRDGFSIDVVSGKADALDLLRQNDFHVVVACERLNDGSGLDLLSQTAKRWPETIRLFAATTDRLSLLRGRLGPFKLFQTLDYPINPGQLGSVLMLAQAAQAADVDTTTIQHIVMGESGSSEVDAPAQTIAAMPVQSLAGARASPRPLPFSVPTVNPPPDVPAARRKPVTRESLSNARHPATPAPSRPAPSHPTGAGFAPPTGATQRSRILERTERTPLVQPRDAVTGEVPSLSLTATHLRPMPEGIAAYRTQLKIGGAAAAVLLALGLGIYLSSGDSESPDATPAAAPAPAPVVEAPDSAADTIIAEIETALTQDDTLRAKAALGRLRGQYPQHARLAFFDTIVSRRDELERESARATREVARAEERAASALAQSGEAAEPTPVPPPATEASAGTAETPAPAPETSVDPQPPEPAGSTPQATPSSFAGRTLETTDASGASTVAAAPPAPAPAATAPARRGSTDPASMPPVVREAKLVRRLAPDYPADAARAGKQGSVEIAFLVTPDGRVAEPVVVSSSDRVFERPALAAVRRWRYDPRMEDGKAVEWRTNARIEFKFSDSE